METPPLLTVTLALPLELRSIPHVLQKVTDLLLPTTIDCAVANDLQLMVQNYGASRAWTVAAMDGAAANGRLDIVQRLHSDRTEGCSVDALVGAAGNGHLDVVKWLNSNYRETHTAWISRTNISLALDEAAANGHVELVKLLLREDFHTLVDTTVPICRALRGGHLDVVQVLVARTKHYRIKDLLATVVRVLLEKVDSDKVGSALEHAAYAGHAATVQLLLDACEDRPSKDPVKMHSVFCALKAAVLNGNVEVVTLLADRRGFYAVCPALRCAMVRNDITIVKVLVKRCTPSTIAHAAAEAAMRGQPKMVKLLLKNCDSLTIELVLEDVVSNDNAATAKAMVENCSALKVETILEAASARGCSALVGLIQDQLDEAKPGDEAASA